MNLRLLSWATLLVSTSDLVDGKRYGSRPSGGPSVSTLVLLPVSVQAFVLLPQRLPPVYSDLQLPAGAQAVQVPHRACSLQLPERIQPQPFIQVLQLGWGPHGQVRRGRVQLKGQKHCGFGRQGRSTGSRRRRGDQRREGSIPLRGEVLLALLPRRRSRSVRQWPVPGGALHHIAPVRRSDSDVPSGTECQGRLGRGTGRAAQGRGFVRRQRMQRGSGPGDGTARDLKW